MTIELCEIVDVIKIENHEIEKLADVIDVEFKGVVMQVFADVLHGRCEIEPLEKTIN